MSTKDGMATLNPFTFPDHSTPYGYLPHDMRAQACWYFYVLAQKAVEDVGKGPETQILLESDLWRDTHFVQQKRSVALLYGLESPAEMDKFWPYVNAEAMSRGLPRPNPRYVNATPALMLIV